MTYLNLESALVCFRPAFKLQASSSIFFGRGGSFSLSLFAVFSSLGRSEIDLNLDDHLFQFRGFEKGQPFADQVSIPVIEHLHDAVTIFANTLAQLSKEEAMYLARIPALVAVFGCNHSYAICTYMLLGLWGVLIGTITARSWHRTFNNSLNSYVAAELVFRKRRLLEGVSIGEADDNEALRRARFVFPSGETNDVEMLKVTKVVSENRPLLKDAGLGESNNNDMERPEAPISVTALTRAGSCVTVVELQFSERFT
ncbi:hypothetical protein V5O48_011518 [Marasmius crinis-equi]|uniref:Uncharacterized protein n=1 Tax=Marasmius crinis-equi TaxID=585013 RepID=A0ABR3F5B3_9AGAR